MVVRVEPVWGETSEIQKMVVRVEPVWGETSEIQKTVVRVEPVEGETSEIQKTVPPENQAVTVDSRRYRRKTRL